VLSRLQRCHKAIGAGRRAAVSLHQVMNGIPPQLGEKVIDRSPTSRTSVCVENIKPFPRQIMPICSGPELKRCGEIRTRLLEDTARKDRPLPAVRSDLLPAGRPQETSSRSLPPDRRRTNRKR